MGACLLCGSSYDDYSSRCRCQFCRMLVLVCNGCQSESSSYICELCQRNGKSVQSIMDMGDDNSECQSSAEIKALTTSTQTKQPTATGLLNGSRPSRKLRILCMHGFRQNASGFKGRSGSLIKKLKTLAELVFVDAPHELPFIYHACPGDQNNDSAPSTHPSLPKVCNKKFAWLIGPGYHEKNDDWTMVDVPFDSLQYRQQTQGFDESLAYLKTVFSQAGPFDGILGFSQGAAMAALLCSQQVKLKGQINFRFAIMCSGFTINTEEFQKGSINFPSLHIYGNDRGRDRQIGSQASRELASLFEDGCAEVIEHDLGHIIPTQSPHIERIKDFLLRFF